MSNDADSVPQPEPTGSALSLATLPNGWTCFHCGDTFLSPDDARSHFGPTPDWLPECIERRTSRKGDLILRVRNAERDALAFREQRDAADEEAESATSQIAGLLVRFRGARTLYDVWCEYHSVEGRMLAAEATLRTLECEMSEVVAAARERTLRPAQCEGGTEQPSPPVLSALNTPVTPHSDPDGTSTVKEQ